MPTITRSALVDRFLARRGAMPITFTAETAPDMRKTGNPYVGATKIAQVNGIGGSWNYGTAVNNQRGREDKPMDFVPHARKWGVRVTHADGKLTGLVEHKGAYYLEVRVGSSLHHEYRFNGAVLDGNLIHPFLAQKREGSRQEVDNPIIVRDYKIENLRQITMDGETFDVVEG